MAKAKQSFVCESCGTHFTSWAGRCSACGEWNTIVEETPVVAGLNVGASLPAEIVSLKDLPTTKVSRLKSGLDEFDRVLGGNDPGIVIGSVVLIAGPPGVGKSTLLLQVASHIAGALYFSAEESLEQIRLRATRLGLAKTALQISAERSLGKILAAVQAQKPSFVVIDSIQTIYDEAVAGTPGSLSQVRDNTWRLQQFAKSTGIPILIVGHITKEGVVAGPKVLEHLVDVVLFLEGEKRTGLRILRSDKNRYGSTEEVGIWQLTETGFETVADPGKLFASLVTEDIPGRALTVTIEGSRAFLVEIQALVTKTSFGYPKRTAQGVDVNRLNLLLAVLESRLGLPMSSYDVFVNVVGGFTLKDPGIDIAIAAAILSSFKQKIIPSKVVLLGEIGLLGEIRPPIALEKRQKEVTRLDYQSPTRIKSVQDLGKIFG